LSPVLGAFCRVAWYNNPMAKVDAIVLAGGTINDPEFKAAAGVDCKSLLILNGKPMAHWVVQALESAESIRSVVVVGPEELRNALDGATVLVEGCHEVENLTKGMDAMPDAERILMVSGDMPLLSPRAIDDFVFNSPEADIVYPTIDKQEIMAEFPDRKWIFIRAKEGEFTGSSAVMFRPEVLRLHMDAMRKVLDARRSVGALVQMWGIGFALKFALGQLSLKDAENRISEVLNVNGRAYVSPYPELAFDVDHASDIRTAEDRLSRLSPA